MAAGQPRKPAERMAEALPDHSSLTRIRQRWGSERFRAIFSRVVRDCLSAGIGSGDVVHMDVEPLERHWSECQWRGLIRADVSLGSLVARHMDAVDPANLDEADRLSRSTGKFKKLCVTDPDASMATSAAGRQPLPSHKQHASVDEFGIWPPPVRGRCRTLASLSIWHHCRYRGGDGTRG